jgi:hypothetical protein
MATVAVATDDGMLALVTLVTRLAALAEAVAELRTAQQHAAQAAAAREVAEQPHAAHRHVTSPQGKSLQARPATPAQRARQDSPALWLLPRGSSTPSTVQPRHPAARSPRKTRGPTR